MKNSYDAGVKMAKQVMNSSDWDNWNTLKSTDDIPTEDYVYLENNGGCDENEYRRGFNSVFVARS